MSQPPAPRPPEDRGKPSVTVIDADEYEAAKKDTAVIALWKRVTERYA